MIVWSKDPTTGNWEVRHQTRIYINGRWPKLRELPFYCLSRTTHSSHKEKDPDSTAEISVASEERKRQQREKKQSQRKKTKLTLVIPERWLEL